MAALYENVEFKPKPPSLPPRGYTVPPPKAEPVVNEYGDDELVYADLDLDDRRTAVVQSQSSGGSVIYGEVNFQALKVSDGTSPEPPPIEDEEPEYAEMEPQPLRKESKSATVAVDLATRPPKRLPIGSGARDQANDKDGRLVVHAIYLGSDDAPKEQPVVMTLQNRTLIVFDVKTKQKIHTFPVDGLRKYGQKDRRFKLEAGRRCPGGAGIYRYDLDRPDVDIPKEIRNAPPGAPSSNTRPAAAASDRADMEF